MKENSIEEDIKILKSIIKINNDYLKGVENQTINQKEIKALEHILSDYKRVLKENAELKNKLKEKDKIIDLMAEEISKNITNTCPFADYNYDLDCENKCNDNYKECWKQYFENKVKEG